MMHHWYIAYQTKEGIHFRIRNTDNDLDSTEGLLREIETMEANVGTRIIPTFWKKLSQEADGLEECVSDDITHSSLLQNIEDPMKHITNLLKGTEFEGCVYLNEDNKPELIYNTDDNNVKQQWDAYCTVRDHLKEFGLQLEDPMVEHNCISGDLVFI